MNERIGFECGNASFKIKLYEESNLRGKVLRREVLILR